MTPAGSLLLTLLTATLAWSCDGQMFQSHDVHTGCSLESVSAHLSLINKHCDASGRVCSFACAKVFLDSFVRCPSTMVRLFGSDNDGMVDRRAALARFAAKCDRVPKSRLVTQINNVTRLNCSINLTAVAAPVATQERRDGGVGSGSSRRHLFAAGRPFGAFGSSSKCPKELRSSVTALATKFKQIRDACDPAGWCWDAYTPGTSCQHYRMDGFTCVGDYCAAMNPQQARPSPFAPF